MGNLTTHIDGNTPADQARGVQMDANVPATQVTIVHKNHLDIGFTESVSKVTHDAIRSREVISASASHGSRSHWAHWSGVRRDAFRSEP